MRQLIAILLIFITLISAPAALAQKKGKKFKEKRFEPVVKEHVEEYAGRYVGIEPSYILEIEVSADGSLSAVSYEGERRADLREIRLAGSRLTATKVYTDGATEKFEAEFVNRILNGESAFGIIVEGMRIELVGATLTRVFYRRTSTVVSH